MKDTVI